MIFETETINQMDEMFNSDNILTTLLIFSFFIFIWYSFKKYKDKISRKKLYVIAGFSITVGIISIFASGFANSYVVGFIGVMFILFGFFVFPRKNRNLGEDEELGKNEELGKKKELSVKENNKKEYWVKVYKNKYQISMAKGMNFYSLKQYQPAIDNFITALKYNQYSEEAWEYLGLINADKRMFEEAKECYVQVLKINIDNLKVREKLKGILKKLKEKDNKKNKAEIENF